MRPYRSVAALEAKEGQLTRPAIFGNEDFFFCQIGHRIALAVGGHKGEFHKSRAGTKGGLLLSPADETYSEKGKRRSRHSQAVLPRVARSRVARNALNARRDT